MGVCFTSETYPEIRWGRKDAEEERKDAGKERKDAEEERRDAKETRRRKEYNKKQSEMIIVILLSSPEPWFFSHSLI